MCVFHGGHSLPVVWMCVVFHGGHSLPIVRMCVCVWLMAVIACLLSLWNEPFFFVCVSQCSVAHMCAALRCAAPVHISVASQASKAPASFVAHPSAWRSRSPGGMAVIACLKPRDLLAMRYCPKHLGQRACFQPLVLGLHQPILTASARASSGQSCSAV